MTFHVAAIRRGVLVNTVPVITERGWLNEAYARARREYPEYYDCVLVIVAQ